MHLVIMLSLALSRARCPPPVQQNYKYALVKPIDATQEQVRVSHSCWRMFSPAPHRPRARSCRFLWAWPLLNPPALRTDHHVHYDTFPLAIQHFVPLDGQVIVSEGGGWALKDADAVEVPVVVVGVTWRLRVSRGSVGGSREVSTLP